MRLGSNPSYITTSKDSVTRGAALWDELRLQLISPWTNGLRKLRRSLPRTKISNPWTIGPRISEGLNPPSLLERPALCLFPPLQESTALCLSPSSKTRPKTSSKYQCINDALTLQSRCTRGKLGINANAKSVHGINDITAALAMLAALTMLTASSYTRHQCSLVKLSSRIR